MSVSPFRERMPEPKAKCKKCGVEILQLTAERNDGMCVPCSGGGISVLRNYNPPEVEPGRHVDWMCIDLTKDTETEAHVDYFFSSAVTDKDPRFKTRSMIVGHNVGLLRIIKATGETELLYPMADDDQERRYARAASVIRKHWEEGKFPQTALFACG